MRGQHEGRGRWAGPREDPPGTGQGRAAWESEASRGGRGGGGVCLVLPSAYRCFTPEWNGLTLVFTLYNFLKCIQQQGFGGTGGDACQDSRTPQNAERSLESRGCGPKSRWRSYWLGDPGQAIQPFRGSGASSVKGQSSHLPHKGQVRLRCTNRLKMPSTEQGLCKWSPSET